MINPVEAKLAGYYSREEHEQILNTLWQQVASLGGYGTKPYDNGVNDTVIAALKAIETFGGRDPLEIKAAERGQ